MSYGAGVEISFKIDDSKVLINRGPASCKEIALSVLRDFRNEHPEGVTAFGPNPDSDLDQAIAWLEKLKVD
jgi:hypothetical protein